MAAHEQTAKKIFKWGLGYFPFTIKSVNIGINKDYMDRMPGNRIPKLIHHCSPTGRSSNGRPRKQWE